MGVSRKDKMSKMVNSILFPGLYTVIISITASLTVRGHKNMSFSYCVSYIFISIFSLKQNQFTYF